MLVSKNWNVKVYDIKTVFIVFIVILSLKKIVCGCWKCHQALDPLILLFFTNSLNNHRKKFCHSTLMLSNCIWQPRFCGWWLPLSAEACNWNLAKRVRLLQSLKLTRKLCDCPSWNYHLHFIEKRFQSFSIETTFLTLKWRYVTLV